MASVLCFGELLWDRLPGGPRLGGAPANVAHHLAQLGVEARLASCVGEDEDGERALAQLREAGVDVTLVARSPRLPTGRVIVATDTPGAPRYHIEAPAAWDAILATAALLEAAAGADAIVYGTLAQRAAPSREALAAALDAAPGALRLCDLNLRPPFADPDVVRASLARATVLKLNEDELAALSGLLDLPAGDALPGHLREGFALRRIYVTRGSGGASAFDGEGRTDRPTPPVAVADSVGAGDAFTSALLFGELAGREAGRILEDACALGAFVASRAGAMPAWPAALRARLLAESGGR